MIFRSLLFIISILILGAGNVIAWPGQIIRTIKAPSENCTGITFDGKNIWVTDRGTDLIYCIKPETGSVISTLEAPAYWPSALAWDGISLWNLDIKGGLPLAENYNAMVYCIDPANGTVLHHTHAPAANASGMASDGQHLFTIQNNNRQIVKFDPSDGTTVQMFPAPTQHASAITYDGNYLWVCDPLKNMLYLVHPDNGVVLFSTEAPSPYVRDLTFDGKNLWAVDSQTDSIYILKASDQDKYRLTNKQTLNLKFSHLTTNFGPGEVKSLDVHIAVPENRINQKITLEPQFSPEGYVIEKDQWNQKTAHWTTRHIAAGENIEAQMHIMAETWDLRYFIYPEKVGDKNAIPGEVRNKYLANNEKFQINHPVIKNAVKEASKGESNLYFLARNLYNYVHEHMYYEMAGGWNTAPAVLARGNGSCSEYAFVYIALCRAAGIPARYVGAVSVRKETSQLDDVFHRWVEIYLPNYGWIPVDPSGGDSNSPAWQSDFFGAVKGKYIVTTQSGGGSNALEWNYNSNEFIVTDPKTFVVSEQIGNWDILK